MYVPNRECKNESKHAHDDMNNGFPQFKCSECGCEINSSGVDGDYNKGARILGFCAGRGYGYVKVSFCPNCGARVVQ